MCLISRRIRAVFVALSLGSRRMQRMVRLKFRTLGTEIFVGGISECPNEHRSTRFFLIFLMVSMLKWFQSTDEPRAHPSAPPS